MFITAGPFTGIKKNHQKLSYYDIVQGFSQFLSLVPGASNLIWERISRDFATVTGSAGFLAFFDAATFIVGKFLSLAVKSKYSAEHQASHQIRCR
jgi:hypothetical protein